MATRKSTRLRGMPIEEPAEHEQQLEHPTVADTQRPQAPAANKSLTQEGNRGKTSIVKSTTTKRKMPHAQDQFSSTIDKISTLPPEILKMILDNIKDPSTMSKLSRSCKKFYSLMMPRLYGRIAVAAMFHAHIPKLIRTLEPLLTIKQKKQLKKEGKYKGQQERYSSGLNEDAKPICATYVRKIVVGVSDPGKKHKYIVERYLEEVFKNLDKLEIVETHVLTKSIGQSLASLKNLKALNLCANNFEVEDMKPLAKIENLKHLYIQDYGYTNEGSKITQSLLRNSKSTLQSLVLETSSYDDLFLRDPKKRDSATDAGRSNEHDFTALKQLTIAGMTLDENSITSLFRSIDFMRLRNLTIKYLHGTNCLFYRTLTSLAIASHGATSLRNLSLKMSEDEYLSTPVQKKEELEAKCGLISSFNTLTTLEVLDYGQYSSDIANNPGLSDMMLRAILKHKNLRTLKISYAGRTSGTNTPYLSATTVGSILDGLPHLQEFEFAPEEKQINEIGQALVRGTNLTSVTCFPHESWASYPPQEQPGINIISGILKAFLDQVDSSCSPKFVWENHYKLKRVSVSYLTWDIASKFGKTGRGIPKPVSADSSDGERNVLFRSVIPIQRIHVGYDLEFGWVEQADRDII